MTDAEKDRFLAQLLPDLSPQGRRTVWMIFAGVMVADEIMRLEGEELRAFLDRAAPSYAELLGLPPEGTCSRCGLPWDSHTERENARRQCASGRAGVGWLSRA